MKPYPIPTLTNEQARRFWRKVEKTTLIDCWEWKGSVTKNVYGGGRYGIWNIPGANLRPHRVAYTLMLGPIEDGLTLDHLCKNQLCCNPAHLEPVTQSENVNRYYADKPKVCKRGHSKPYPGNCEACARYRQAKYKSRKETCMDTPENLKEQIKATLRRKGITSLGEIDGFMITQFSKRLDELTPDELARVIDSLPEVE